MENQQPGQMVTLSVEQLRQLMRQEMGAENNRGKGLPEIKVREHWAQWEKAELDSGKRLDAKVCRVHRPLILDLPFDYNGQTLKLGDVQIPDVTKNMGLIWFERLQVKPTELSQRRMSQGVATSPDFFSPGYCNRVLATAQACMTWRLNENSPLRGMPRLEADDDARRECYFRTEEQLEDFLRYAHPTLREMARLCCNNGGMRKGEVRRLVHTKSKVNPLSGWVNWHEKTIVLPKGRGATKNGKGREFPILPKDYDMLLRRRHFSESIGTEFLFPNPHDPKTATADGTITHWVREAAEKWGQLLGGHRPIFHAFRHTWATWAGIKGLDFNVIKEQGGWTNSEVAMAYVAQAKAVLEATKAKLSRSVQEVLDEAVAQHEARAPKRRYRPEQEEVTQ